MTKKIKYMIIGKASLFIIILLIIYSMINQLFLAKTYEVRTNLNYYFSNRILSDRLKGFYDEKENTIDIVFLGASQTHCSINPIVLWDEYKITSYDMSADQQDLATSYYYLKEVFKTQSPKLVVLEAGQLNYDMGAVSMHFSLDFMKPSCNKWIAIWERVKPEDRKELLIPMIRYHTRWSELTEDDFKFFTEKREHKFNGFWAYCVTSPLLPESDNGDKEPFMTDEYLTKYLDAISELCAKKNVKLIFLKTPTAVGNLYKRNIEFISDYAIKNEITFLNYNFLGVEIGLDYETDMADIVHMNIYGAEKFTKRLGNDLLNEFYFDGNYEAETVERYNAKSEYYWNVYKEYQYSITEHAEK